MKWANMPIGLGQGMTRTGVTPSWAPEATFLLLLVEGPGDR